MESGRARDRWIHRHRGDSARAQDRELDAQLAAAANSKHAAPIENEIKLWQQRVGLMNALVEVHLTKANNVGL